MKDTKIEIVKGVEVSIKPSLEHTPAKDHIVNVIKASLSAIPVIGGPISSLIGDYIPKKKEERLLNFMKELTIKLEEYAQNIDVKYIKTEDFAYLFEECIKGVLSNYQEQKLFCFKGIIINSLRQDLKKEQKEYYLHLVNSLTDLHLRILAISNDPEAYFRSYELDTNSIQGVGFSKVFEVALEGIESEMIKSTYGELYQMGLLNTDKSIFGTLTAGRGFAIVTGRITNLGKSFIDFCTKY